MSLSKSTAGGASRTGTCCFICKSSEDDELLYGKLIGKWRIQVHYYCLLLTSNLVQNGESDEVGIFGFLQEDIKAEVARIKSQKCYVCKAPYANISCCAKKCFRTFHTVCGRRAGCLNHFVDTYQSWCDKHVEVEREGRHGEEDSCGICYEELGAWDKLESIRAPCCQNGWFHRRCVAQFAQSAGYFFKCPLCNNNTDQFKQAIQRRGVYIPEKDAAWELEPNAFGEQLERPSECDAEVCLCRYGRDYDTIDGKWDLRLCETCGSTCRHDLCMARPTKNYVCSFCQPIVGDEPPAAVLALAEESRRAEAARRRPSISSSSEASTSSGSTIRPQARARSRKIRLRSSSSSSVTSSSSSTIAIRKKPKRPLSPSDSEPEPADLADLIRQLPQETREKLLRSRAVICLEKLTTAQIQQLSQPQTKQPASAAATTQNSSSQSSLEFDFNYRATMNKQKRRKSVACDLHFLRQVLRSDTDDALTTTTEDVSGDRTPPGRKSEVAKERGSSFAKKFKLKLGASSRKRRIVSSSESDPEGGGAGAKKACPATAPAANKSKSRISLFPPEDDSENTCPNSPRKLSATSTSSTISSETPVPSQLATIASPPPQPPSAPGGTVEPKTDELKSANSSSSTVKKCQTTLNSFFKKSPEESTVNNGSGSGGSSGSAIPSSSDRKKKQSGGGGGARKKLVELDRSQRNLLDFFNRC